MNRPEMPTCPECAGERGRHSFACRSARKPRRDPRLPEPKPEAEPEPEGSR